MKEKHIIDILDQGPLAGLTESEVRTISTHAETCSPCRQAYDAARISTLLINERAAETMEPSPFFQTRVLAAWREQQAGDNVAVFSRLWKTTGALVASMAVTTAALAVFSLAAPGSETPEATAALAPYSAEAVVLDQNQDDGQMTYEQVLNAIYADQEEAR